MGRRGEEEKRTRRGARRPRRAQGHVARATSASHTSPFRCSGRRRRRHRARGPCSRRPRASRRPRRGRPAAR